MLQQCLATLTVTTMACSTNGQARPRMQSVKASGAHAGKASVLRMGTVVRAGLPSCEDFERLFLEAGWCDEEVVEQAEAHLSAYMTRKKKHARCCSACACLSRSCVEEWSQTV